MGKILQISLELNFTTNTFGCYALLAAPTTFSSIGPKNWYFECVMPLSGEK